jgi:hypothetical protein
MEKPHQGNLVGLFCVCARQGAWCVSTNQSVVVTDW